MIVMVYCFKKLQLINCNFLLYFQTILEAEYNDYLQKLSAWEMEQKRQMVEFTITDQDINADMRLSSPEVKAFK